MIPTLITERLVMRAPTWDDFDAYAAFRASPRMSSVGGPYDRGQAFQQMCALIGHWHLRGYGRWLVTDKTTGAPCGVVGIFHPEGWPEAELAWSLYDDAEGRGIAYEAARAARAYVYDRLGWTTLISLVDPANTRSAATAARLGCTTGETFDHATYGTLHIARHPAPQDCALTPAPYQIKELAA